MEPSDESISDEEAMVAALGEAQQAGRAGDVPVGAVVVAAGRIVAGAGNRRHVDGDPLAHAELLALRQAATVLGSWRLDGTTMVVTLEPCAMCAGALVQARVARLVYAAADPKAGAAGSLYNLCSDPRLAHQVEVSPGVQAGAAGRLLQEFFSARR